MNEELCFEKIGYVNKLTKQTGVDFGKKKFIFHRPDFIFPRLIIYTKNCGRIEL